MPCDGELAISKDCDPKLWWREISKETVVENMNPQYHMNRLEFEGQAN